MRVLSLIILFFLNCSYILGTITRDSSFGVETSRGAVVRVDMSELLRAQSPFIQLLLHADSPQQKALLKTLSPDQGEVLAEIFLNLLKLPKSFVGRKFLTRSLASFLEKASKRRVSSKSRRRLFLQHHKSVKALLAFFKDSLTRVMLQGDTSA